MAFVCPPKDETETKTQLLVNLKGIVQNVENALSVSVNPVCMPCFFPVCDLPCIPRDCLPCCPSPPCCPSSSNGPSPYSGPSPPCCTCPPCSTNKENEVEKPFNPPNVMVCYKICQKNGKSEGQNGYQDEEVHRLKQSKSRELRGGILYTGCDCEKRCGLQDDCPRTGCHGAPECLTSPPTCGPSEFCNGKHLGKKPSSSLRKKKKNGNGGDGNGEYSTAKYKCFPAVINGPVCPTTCLQM